MIENCTIRKNSGDSYGGGMQFFDCSTIVRNCVISNNTTVTAGGGMHIVQVATSNFSPQIINCTFGGNSTVDRGGGISWQAGTAPLQLVNCSITSNSAPIAGGGVYVYPSGGVNRLTLSNTTVCGNTVRPNISGLYTSDSLSTVCDCAGDVDGNGLVNAPDLAILLSVWGTNAAGFPSADTNRDGLVNGPDLSRLLSNWGICAP